VKKRTDIERVNEKLVMEISRLKVENDALRAQLAALTQKVATR